MTTCSKCGDCCRAIRIAGTKAEIQATYPDDNEDKIFILEHWHEISEEEAERRVPGLGGVNKYGNRGSYFECDAFDSEHNLCGAHEARPPVCRGFPWYKEYGLGVSGETLIPFKQCSFWLDVKKGIEVGS